MFRKLLAAALCACLLFAGAANLEAFSARADEGDFIERMENLLKEKSVEADVSAAEANGGEAEEMSAEEAKQAYQAMQDEMFDLPEPAQDDQVYASASGVDYSIWGTGVKITLPSGSYKYSSSSTLIAYYCPTISKMIGFGKASYAGLSTWKNSLTSSGCSTGYETINGISTVYGLKYETDKGYSVSYYYNYGGYSYCVMIVQASYDEAEYFISNVMSTLRSGSTATATPNPTATPKPTATPAPSASEVRYNIWDSGVYLTLPAGSYQYSKDSTILTWVCPQQDNLMVGFGWSNYTNLSDWEGAFERDGCTTGYEDINDVSTVWGTKPQYDGYTVQYAFVRGDRGYMIMAVGVTYDQAEFFIEEIMSTLSTSKVAPTPDSTQNRWIVLPESLKRIETEAFKGSNVVAVEVPDGCESIGARAFANCKKLEEIYIPASVNSIADDAFEGCGADFSITVEDVDTYACEYADQHGIEWAMG